MKRMSRRAFNIYLRTGLIVEDEEPAQLKFNPWHDPEDGRFTFAGQGNYSGGGHSPSGGGSRSTVTRNRTASAVRGGNASRQVKPAAPSRLSVPRTKPSAAPPQSASKRAPPTSSPSKPKSGAGVTSVPPHAAQPAPVRESADPNQDNGLEGVLEKLGKEANSNLSHLKNRGIDIATKVTAYTLTTAAINNPFTSDLAARLLTQWRDGTSPYNEPGKAEFFAWDSGETHELFFGDSGDYYNSITNLGIQQMAAAGGGVIQNGISSKDVRNISKYGAADLANGFQDGINLGDVIGTFTNGVTMRSKDGYIYFTGTNAMSLTSFAAENKLQHHQVVNPASGRFSTTYQIFEWRVPIPQKLQAKRK